MTFDDVLITGVHRGLGHELAGACVERGSRVYGVSRGVPDDLASHDRFFFERADLLEYGRIPAVLSSLLAEVEGLDLVILNAGTLGGIADLRDTSLDRLRLTMDLNVWANKVIIDELMDGPWSVRQIVAVSSGAAFNGSGGWGAYSISKSALNLLVRVYADEHPDTHFTALAPGVVRTDMVERILDTPESPRWPAVSRIQAAARESGLLEPREAALLFLDTVPGLLSRESGAFADVRKM
jgi:NAD(P)-dependent dehydrogenase (short-subunit alcohol dehydrogenase family)